ncbi:uncharacterized protein EI90DRAFT_902147 [Cantharellus anzutake]|uniref:uncharacterized protein n=1 Tax=Cantharellus anzutake TaxID=1750568 RepID=UPI001902C9D9|nr:uncharacterized protein EI90DRAFT_902147 [Cantharellus anzutake]KAF8331928.1 hypothetical protein EI90DRAFT_902147 [Cantharellus anzutake]
MMDTDTHRMSLISRRLSTLWPKITSSSRKLSSSLADLCSYIQSTPDAHLSPIKELAIRKEDDGVRHEFLLLRLAKPTGEEFWVRLERKGPTGTLSRLMSSEWEANDVAILSGKRSSLLGRAKSVEKTRIIFRVPPSLNDLLRVLNALRKESKSYQLWPVRNNLLLHRSSSITLLVFLNC